PVAPPAPEPFADGVYFGLDEALYRADPALGSTDVKKLATSPADFWWGSRHNPNREPEKDSPALLVGSAVHRYVLEGREAFDAEYAPAEHPGNVKAGIREREVIEASGRTAIKRQDYDRILAAAHIIRSNPVLASAFDGGQPEVSVFWTAGGIRRKARVDYLRTRANVDLKSIANVNGLPFPIACRRAIASFRYDVQAAHYLDARDAMRGLVAAGAVTGDHDPAWLKACVAADTYAHVLVFWQKENSPLTWGTTLSAGNPILDIARMVILRAEDNWRRLTAQFGFDTPWLEAQPLEELDLSEMPGWFAL
ncbi:PD-(D/E)XK nuclease-like domain-containing protein, partial [Methylobacterium indicum]|uniref:PD-(D/E)XK nuclease-like domain-containing protein n=2 Tax=Methylobacterium indicum TaxID=1775910 RepID=UPI000734C433